MSKPLVNKSHDSNFLNADDDFESQEMNDHYDEDSYLRSHDYSKNFSQVKQNPSKLGQVGNTSKLQKLNSSDTYKSKNDLMNTKIQIFQDNLNRKKALLKEKKFELQQKEEVFQDVYMDQKDDLDLICDDLNDALERTSIINNRLMKDANEHQDNLDRTKYEFLSKLKNNFPDRKFKTQTVIQNSLDQRPDKHPNKGQMQSQNAVLTITNDLNKTQKELNDKKEELKKIDFTNPELAPEIHILKKKYTAKAKSRSVLKPEILEAYNDIFKIPSVDEILRNNKDIEDVLQDAKTQEERKNIMSGLMLGRKPPTQAHLNYNANIAQGVVNDAIGNIEGNRKPRDDYSDELKKPEFNNDLQALINKYASPSDERPKQAEQSPKFYDNQNGIIYEEPEIGSDRQVIQPIQTHKKDTDEFKNYISRQRSEIDHLWDKVDEIKMVEDPYNQNKINYYNDDIGVNLEDDPNFNLKPLDHINLQDLVPTPTQIMYINKSNYTKSQDFPAESSTLDPNKNMSNQMKKFSNVSAQQDSNKQSSKISNSIPTESNFSKTNQLSSKAFEENQNNFKNGKKESNEAHSKGQTDERTPNKNINTNNNYHSPNKNIYESPNYGRETGDFFRHNEEKSPYKDSNGQKKGAGKNYKNQISDNYGVLDEVKSIENSTVFGDRTSQLLPDKTLPSSPKNDTNYNRTGAKNSSQKIENTSSGYQGGFGGGQNKSLMSEVKRQAAENRKSLESSSGNNSSVYNRSRNFDLGQSQNFSLNQNFVTGNQPYKDPIENKSSDIFTNNTNLTNQKNTVSTKNVVSKKEEFKDTIGSQKLDIKIAEDWGFGPNADEYIDEDPFDEDFEGYVPTGVGNVDNTKTKNDKLSENKSNSLQFVNSTSGMNMPKSNNGQSQNLGGTKSNYDKSQNLGGSKDYQYSNIESGLLMPSSNFETSKKTEDLDFLYGDKNNDNVEKGWMKATEKPQPTNTNANKKNIKEDPINFDENYDEEFEDEYDEPWDVEGNDDWGDLILE